MKVLESYYPAPPDVDFEARGKVHEYDLKLEVGIQDGIEEVALHTVFVQFLQTMTKAADHPIDLLDVRDNGITPENVPEGEEFRKNFSIEQVSAKARKIFVGFKLRSLTPLSVLKHRMFAYLRNNHLYVRIHSGGYQHGLRYAYLGYLRHESPNTANVQEWKDTINSAINAVWKNKSMLTEEVKQHILQKYSRQVTKHKVSFPINISKEVLYATNTANQKVESLALVVTTPIAFVAPVKKLMESVLLQAKAIPQFVPADMRKEDPEIYFNVLTSQAKFVHHHRNIQLEGIDPSKFNQDLKPILQKHPNVHKVYLNAQKKMAHVSTTNDHYLLVCDWIDKQLPKLNLGYHPTRVQRLQGSVHTKATNGTKYAHLFQDDQSVMTDTSSFDPSTIKTTRTNAWTRKMPIKISYVTQASDFPALPSPGTESTRDTVITADTDNIDSIISAAIQKVEQEQTQKLELITKEMNSKVAQLEESIKQMVQKVIEATYQSLKTSDIFVTKEDNLALQLEVTSISKKLDALMEALTQPKGNPISSPPRKNQRVSHSSPDSSAAPTPDVEMGEREK